MAHKPQEHAQQDGHRAADRKPVRRVVIAGGGTAGWMAAAVISRILGKVLDITLIESDEIGSVGVGEATIPTLMMFHQVLELNEADVMRATQASFKLGISFENWRNVNEHYIHSFGVTGTDHWTAGFQHFWHKGRQRGLASDFGDYCLELKAAQYGRFAHLPNDGLNYAYHLDATLYAKFLRTFSEGFGVKRIEGKIAQVITDPANGHVSALKLDNGALLEGDLFIDCTGFRSLLLGETMGVEYDDWSQWLFNDTAIAVQTASSGEPVPYTRSIAHGAGWQWQIPLQHRVGNGHVFSSKYMDIDEAKQILLNNLQGEPTTKPREIKFTPGQRKQSWKGNVVAVGLSSGFLEPIESTSIHLIQRNLIRLMQMFPADGICQSDVDEYNTQVHSEIAHIRDFIILHYKVTNRTDTPYWQAAKEMTVPATLQHRIDLFRETGRVFRTEGELFAESSWLQVMFGQGMMPEQHHQTADLMSDAELSKFLSGIRGGIENTVRQMPSHQAYLQQFCRATPPQR